MTDIKVLFLCTGNSARSQMAEGWLRQLADEQVTALSAGLNPKGVNPLAIAVMRDAGVDISRQVSKHVAEFLGQPIQYVVTVCDNAMSVAQCFRLPTSTCIGASPIPPCPPMLPHRWRRFAAHAICSRSASQRNCFCCSFDPGRSRAGEDESNTARMRANHARRSAPRDARRSGDEPYADSASAASCWR